VDDHHAQPSIGAEPRGSAARKSRILAPGQIKQVLAALRGRPALPGGVGSRLRLGCARRDRRAALANVDLDGRKIRVDVP